MREYNYEEGSMKNNLIEISLGEILCSNNLTISTAESCTGGMVAAKLISYPGISNVFNEGVITYSNESKIKRLNVNEKTLENFGAVSKETAMEMAIGIAKEAQSDVAISITGIAGPGGGTKDKPVGLVYIGIYVKGLIRIEKCNFDGDREEVRYATTLKALELAREEIINYLKRG